jgi:4-hydroxybenzoate polyprenyltransferase
VEANSRVLIKIQSLLSNPMRQLMAMLRLMRPANIVTAISDILAGFAIAKYTMVASWNAISVSSMLLLVASTIGLYGGGVVMNDFFDAELDKTERPERPIPSGAITKKSAALLGLSLLLGGIGAAALVHAGKLISLSTYLAIAIAISAVVYDKWGKHQPYFGPVNMGLCRGLNLLLGISLLPNVVERYWAIGLVPVVYIAAITMISRGEVHGSRKTPLTSAVALYGIVIATIGYIAFRNFMLSYAVIFLLLFSIMIFLPLRRAIQNPEGRFIGKAVKAGVIALIIMNAAWAAAFGSFYFALIILSLLPVSLWLAKAFAVT